MTSFTQVKPSTLHQVLSAVAAPDTDLPDWPQVEAALTVRALTPGEVVFRQDAPLGDLLVVRAGVVRLGYLQSDGTEWIKSFIAEGGVFGSLAALVPGGRTPYMATAMTAAEVERVPFALLDALGRRHAVWAGVLLRMALVYAARKEQRERELLTMTAAERYAALQANPPPWWGRVPQQDLARHLGVTPVGLSRIIGRLRRDAALKLRSPAPD